MKTIISKFISSSICLVVLFISTLYISQVAFADTTSTLLPTNDGFYLQWTPKTGSVHYTMVDESSCNGQTDYVHTVTAGDRDSYVINLSSVPNGATLTQIDITPCASRASSGSTNPVMNLFYRLNGANSSDSGSYSLTGVTPVVLSATSFTGLSAVKSSTSTIEIGAVLTSGAKGARLSQISTVITYTPLSSPSSLMAVSAGTEAALLSWTDNSSNEDGFKIERGTDGINFSQINTVGSNVTSYTDPNVIGTYYYRVRAFNSGGDSGYSSTANTTVVLNAPTNLTASALSTESSRLTWTDNSSNESGYKIERGTDGINFSQIATVSANVTGYTDPNVIGNYYYQVRAYKGSNNSAYSNVANITVPLNAPSNLTAIATGSAALLSWTDHSTNESGF